MKIILANIVVLVIVVVVVSNINDYNTIIQDLFASKQDKINEIVNKHTIQDKIEGDSNASLDLIIHYGVVHYLAIFEHELSTSDLTLDELKDKFKFEKLRDELYCKGYNLTELIDSIVDII